MARVDAPESPRPVPGADGLVTNRPGLCLAIYVADCAAVYLADREVQAIGLVHAGKKGAELGIVTEAIATMRKAFGTDPANLVVQVAPCIRPPNYEVDFAAEIVRQAREAGVRDISTAAPAPPPTRRNTTPTAAKEAAPDVSLLWPQSLRSIQN